MNKISKYSAGFIISIAIIIRLVSIDFSNLDKYIITNYDGLGYYMYLPAIFIHQDITQYEWLDEIDEKYKVAGDDWMFQIGKHENGNHVTKYLGGVSILQLPFFLIGHLVAIATDYPADGFSVPYQIALSFGSLVYFVLILFLLRSILLRYYSDEVTALSLILLFLASNAIEYIAIEAGQCHGYIMLMYTLIIWLSIKWHEKPSKVLAICIGLVIGLATIMRPTELIIFLIPLLWETHSKAASKTKWALVKKHKNHVALVILATVVGALPQGVYWLYVTGSPIHTIGSKWYFLNPYFRVLFGWEKGWFIYTPVTIFFVLGFFFMKDRPFKKSVLWFCVLNIWIVIAWSVWRYGGSYSTRALVQSYPVFALALGSFLTWVLGTKFRPVFYALAIYLTCVNLFQVWQYREGIIRHDENNRAYYQAIYLDKNPSPLDMSMLDGGERMPSSVTPNVYLNNVVTKKEIEANSYFYEVNVRPESWIDMNLDLRTTSGFWKGFIVLTVEDENGKTVKERKFRMFNHLTKSTRVNRYRMQLEMPDGAKKLKIRLGGGEDVRGKVHGLVVRTQS